MKVDELVQDISDSFNCCGFCDDITTCCTRGPYALDDLVALFKQYEALEEAAQAVRYEENTDAVMDALYAALDALDKAKEES